MQTALRRCRGTAACYMAQHSSNEAKQLVGSRDQPAPAFARSPRLWRLAAKVLRLHALAPGTRRAATWQWAMASSRYDTGWPFKLRARRCARLEGVGLSPALD